MHERWIRRALWVVVVTVGFGIPLLVLAAQTVPNEIKQPGTQPGEVGTFASPDNCDNCHGSTVNPDLEPNFGWRGGMMGNAGRDPLFWATLAVAEQDFLPGSDPATRGGAGDLCIRCHSVGGWTNQHSTPTDGSGLAGNEDDGVECEFCHLLTNPDPPVNVPGTDEVQNAPFESHDPDTGEPYLGSGQYVINGTGVRLGPYDDAQARHQWLASSFHREAELCGTCHDVSNPAVGDLAHNFGAQEIMLQPGTYSGVLGGPMEAKAAFNNPPYRYGIVERTFSEWKAGALDTLRVNDYDTLPADLKAGAISLAYHRAFDARGDADYEDTTPRFYTCQTCHMAASTGVGCNKAGTPLRTDLPRHDQTGMSHWVGKAIQYMDTRGTLLFGGPLSQIQRDAMNAAALRAEEHLRSAATLGGTQAGSRLVIRVTNLTGHKLITGYPEGHRMWLNVRWLDDVGTLIREDGDYGPIGRSVDDLDGVPHQVESILDPANTVIWEVNPGMDQGWASQLLALGYDPDLAVEYDRLTDAVVHRLGELAGEPPGTSYHSFHFVLNNVITHDNRIPPYGFSYDEARTRNALPMPVTQFGNPGPGGTYNYWDEVSLNIPQGTASAELRLYYQQTSWEYVQFLWLQNDRLNAFLGDEGVNLLDAWLNTGMAAPVEMAMTTVTLEPVIVPGEASHQNTPAEQMLVTAYDKATGAITVVYTPACDATDHNIYYGDLASISSYGYSGVECSVGTTGSATFDPGLPGAFFLIVANDGVEEGSYGADGDGLQRPEDLGTPVCDRPQNLGGVVCE